jgi:Myb-like DNA-binding domain
MKPEVDTQLLNVGAWNDTEKELFESACKKYGEGRWKLISDMVKTRYVISACVLYDNNLHMT